MTLGSSAPPEPRSRIANNPTLLFSWWCTLFSATLILIRVVGRKVRSDAFFKEDKVMALSVIPLFIRMALIHVVLIYGTNNVDTFGLTAKQIAERSTGSRLVLASRIFYAMFIWMSKFTVSEFLKRTFYNTWRQTYENILHGIRIFLGLTFVAVVIATLAECQPFDHYWQVVPDPGPKCRQGYAQLVTMGACDIITDVLLVAFPIPVVITAHVSRGRKAFLVLLFSISLILVGITATRVPKVIEMRGRQQYRTVWASIEILVSTFVSNAVIVGSFARDKGSKKNKYRKQSVSDSIERAPMRRPTLPVNQTNNSEEDLFRSIGCRMPAELMEEEEEEMPVPAQAVTLQTLSKEDLEMGDLDASLRNNRWERSGNSRVRFGSGGGSDRENTSYLAAFLRETAHTDRRRSRSATPHAPSSPTDMAIADVGGLLGDATPTTHGSPRSKPGTGRSTPVSIIGSDGSPPLQQQPLSRSLFQDIGGLLSRTGGMSPSRSNSRRSSRRRPMPDLSTSASASRSPSPRSGRAGDRDRSRSKSRPRIRTALSHSVHAYDNGDSGNNNNDAAGDPSAGGPELKDVGGLTK